MSAFKCRFSLIIATCFALLLLKATWVSPFLLANQPGTQNDGDDHVIFFEIPHPILNQEAQGQSSSQVPPQVQFQIKSQLQSEQISHSQQQQPQLKFNPQSDLQAQLQAQLQTQLQSELQSQLQDQLDAQLHQQVPQASDNDLMTSASQPQVVSVLSVPNVNDRYNQRAHEPELEGQSISLTVPISSLRTSQSGQAGLFFRPSTQAANRQYQIESPLIEYLSPSESNEHIIIEKNLRDSLVLSQPQRNKHQYTNHDSGSAQQQQYQQKQLQPKSPAQIHHLQQQLAINNDRQQQNERYTTTPIPTATSEPDSHHYQDQLQQPPLPPPPQQPQAQYQQEWPNDQPSRPNLALTLHQNAVQTNRTHQVEPEMSSGVSSFLSSLSDTSPELLVRIRDLLRQAAMQAKNFTSEEDPRSSYYPKTSIIESSDGQDGTALSPIETSRAGLGQKEVLKSKLFGGRSHTMLDTFLTSHNLSSHDEVKIPLIVIAMPRLLSLRRNQVASSQPKLVNLTTVTTATTSYPDNYSLPITTKPANNYNQTLYTVPSLTQLILNSTNISMPYNQTSSDNNSLRHQQQPAAQTSPPQLPITTDAIPQYTMAPYARHFSLAGTVPLLRQLAYSQPGPSQYQAIPRHLPQSLLNRTSELIHTGPILRGLPIFAAEQQAHPHSIQIINRANAASESPSEYQIRLHQETRHNNNSNSTNINNPNIMRIQLADYAPQFLTESNQPIAQQLQASTRPQSAYELQIHDGRHHHERQTASPEYSPNELQPLQSTTTKDAASHPGPLVYRDNWPQGTIYLQLPANDSLSKNLTDRDELKASQHYPSSFKLQVRRTAAANSAISRRVSSKVKNIESFESGLSKLRPLFGVAGKLNSARSEAHEDGRKLSAGQLLRLFAHSADQRSISNVRQGDQPLHTSLNQHLAGPEIRSATKMVLMVVR